jgi:two-component system, response regulator PdtaR
MKGTIKNILIVEDEAIFQLFLKRTLSHLGFNILGQTKSFDDTMSFLEKQTVDLIIIDIGIKGNVDGINLVKELKNKGNQTPIIFVTGNSDQATSSRAKELNPLNIIIKPVNESDLIKVFTPLLKK